MFIISVLFGFILLSAGSALAQSYYFELPQEIVHVYWNEDGTQSLHYTYFFINSPSGQAVDIEYIDIGLPNSNFDVNSISADVDGIAVTDISRSGFEGEGVGVAVGLGGNSIKPGQSGQVNVFIGTVRNVVYPDTEDDNYASAVFSPNYFGSSYIYGKTDLTVIFHLPPGVQPDEPKWHASPSGWESEPRTYIDDQGLVTYEWRNTNANGYTQYLFGASFPNKYVPESAITRPSLLENLGLASEDLITFAICGGFLLFILLIIFASVRGSQRRKLRYLPPKIAIEGHGIKRGLTAIEAAILLEQPMDKIMTMILFAVIKKNAASVVSRDPLKLKISQPLPDKLRPYEMKFLEAFRKTKAASRRTALQNMMIDLIKSITKKMKGFSRRESVAYYKKIMKRAWAQVEAANTPEVKSQKYDEVMEWTMLDRDYEDRTREVFRSGPVFLPMWWGRYDPAYGRSTTVRPISTPSGTGRTTTLPHLPGSDFAASMVNGVQDFSSSVVGDLTKFTSKITNKTNPIPVSTSSGRGSGGGCACACACAGCACACAGGGR